MRAKNKPGFAHIISMEDIMRKAAQYPPMYFHEDRAREVFTTVAHAWKARHGFYATLETPQAKFTPQQLRKKPRELANYFYFLALMMRGGINSDDAFRVVAALWRHHPKLFRPRFVHKVSESELRAYIREAISGFQDTSNGINGAGTFAYKFEEHVRHWIINARALHEEFDGDARLLFAGATNFEEAFLSAESHIKGMRRKIFALLALWYQEFGLIAQFSLPIVVDFHCLRVLFQHKIVRARMKLLGRGNSEREDRIRPETIREFRGIQISEKLVNAVMAWSTRFLEEHGLTSYDVSHGLWYLSRELCANYHGNTSRTAKAGSKRLTAFLVRTRDLQERPWPSNYRDPCKFCPIEKTCRIRVPSGPYYDWGRVVNAGAHVVFPLRTELLAESWATMPRMFPNSKSRTHAPTAKQLSKHSHVQHPLFPEK